jgi:hypothetical protein
MENNDKQVPHLWWLIAIFVLLMILKSYWIFNSTGPVVFWDEFIYRNNAQNIFNMEPYGDAHYPPLYPMFLSLAFFSKTYWYEWMIFINIILSSSIIFPVYLIGKGLLPKQAVFIPVIIVALLPFHAVYPSLLMSENLSISIFLFAIYFALIHNNRNLLSAAMLGAFLALSYLTKYLFLPVIPFLIVVWWLIPLLKKELKGKGLREKLQLSGLSAVTAGFLITYLPWLLYAHYSSITAGKAMGLSLISIYRTQIRNVAFGLSDAEIGVPNFRSLVLWITTYGSYLILALAPFLLILCIYFWMRLYKNGEHQFKGKIYFLTVILLTVGYLLLAIQHSWGASSYYPIPNFLGRYLMHLTPLYSIAGVIALHKLIRHIKSVKCIAIITMSLFSLLLIYTAQKILYEQAVWNLPPWFADIVFNSPDSFVYKHHVILWEVLALILFTDILLILGNKYESLIKRYMLPVVAGLLIFFQFSMFYIASNRSMGHSNLPLHGRILAPILRNDYNNGISAIALKIDIPYLTAESLLNSLYFWGGIPKSKIIVCTTNKCPEEIPENVKQYLLSGTHYDSYDYLSAFTYNLGQSKYYLYAITWDKITMPAPVIEDFGPKSTKAGVGFNVQPSGRSALWFRTRYASTSTVIVFKGVELATTHGNNNILTASVPNKLFKTSGKYIIYLLDKSTGRKSNPVVFIVK